MKPLTKFKTKFKRFIGILGPGLITGASDDDPSGIATYSQAGAAFGLTTLWTALLTFPMMAAIQEMCARIGVVTTKGLTGNIRIHYSPVLVYAMLIISFPAITLNIGADIAAMGAVANLMLPAIPAFLFSLVFTVILIIIIIKYPYQKLSLILKWLCLTLLLYIIVPFIIKTNWKSALIHTIVPHIEYNKAFFNLLVALLGTTISPYLFFWQATMEAEDVAHRSRRIVVNKNFIDKMEKDVTFGMFFSNLIMFFIILTTGTVLYDAGIRNINSVEDAAKALEPLTGKLTYFIFSLGVIGTGFLAIPVLGGSLSYILAESFGWKQGLDKKFHEAKGFYLTLIFSLLLGLTLNILKISPIKALIYSAVLYGISAPVMIVVIIHICNSKKIMGKHTNSLLSNILGFLTLLLMTAALAALVYFTF